MDSIFLSLILHKTTKRIHPLINLSFLSGKAVPENARTEVWSSLLRINYALLFLHTDTAQNKCCCTTRIACSSTIHTRRWVTTIQGGALQWLFRFSQEKEFHPNPTEDERRNGFPPRKSFPIVCSFLSRKKPYLNLTE